MSPRRLERRIAVVNCDRPDQTIFRFGSKIGIDLGDLSKLIIEASNIGQKVRTTSGPWARTNARPWGRVGTSSKVRTLETSVHRPLADICDLPNLDQVSALLIPGALSNPTKKEVKESEMMKRVIDLIQRAHHAGIPILGMCFGHQIIAAAFGVYSTQIHENTRPEIGFHSVTLTDKGREDLLFEGVPTEFQGAFFHSYEVLWVPEGGDLLAVGEDVRIQAFRMGETTWAAQFHSDYDETNVNGLIALRKETGGIPEGRGVLVDADATNNCRPLLTFLDLVRNM